MRPWPVHSLTLSDAAGELATIPVSVTQSLEWPSVDPSQRIIYQRTTAAHPLTFCVPDEALLSQLTSVRLNSGSDRPARSYGIEPVARDAADVVLTLCAEGTARDVRYGRFHAIELLPEQAIGTAFTLDGTTFTVQSLRAVGPGEEPTLPPDQMRVVVTITISTSAPLDWPRYTPTLRLATGQVLTAGELATTARQLSAQYLVPLVATPLDAAWELTPPGGAQTLRWRTVLSPPIDRFTVLRAALEISDTHIERQADGSWALSTRVTNRSDHALRLTSADVQLMQEDQPLPLPEVPALQPELPPHAERVLIVPLPSGAVRQPLTLRIGAERLQISMSS